MKPRLSLPIFLLTMMLLVTGIHSCTHDNDLLAPSQGSDIKRGTDIVDMSAGWTFDKSHSSVLWETAYMGSAALLTGRFNQFGVTSMKFDEANPANTSFEGWVRLNTVNTGEPGRDGNCLLTTFGTNATNVDQVENIARIKSTKVEMSTADKGYIITADLTFKGVTKPVTVKLDYTGTASYTGTTPYQLAGLVAKFQFNAKSDFGVSSNNISDKIGVTINCNFKKS